MTFEALRERLKCRLCDCHFIKKYSLFVFEVVKAHAARRPKHLRTIRYQGNGQFMVAGGQLNLRRKFKPEML
jgi:flavin reductase (DIM6/NTAB) family NADH-FMN oxidoreductase RutF